MISKRRLKRLARWLVAVALFASGALARRRKRGAQRGEVRVLVLHRVGAPGAGPQPLTMPHLAFRKMLAGLTRRYRVADLDACLQAVERGDSRPHVLLTFDDGHCDQAEQAWPLLRAAGCSAIFFPTTSFLDGEPLWWEVVAASLGTNRGDHFGTAAETEIARLKTLSATRRREQVGVLLNSLDNDAQLGRPMSWDQVRRMAGEGAAFGSHGVHHLILPRCSDAEMENELAESRRRLEEEIGREVEAFACPDAQCDARSRSAISRNGYRAAFGDLGGPFTRKNERRRIPRIPVSGDLYALAGRFSWSLFEAGMLGALPGPGRTNR